eukprot:2324919-Rhodomonas_salina.2
MRAPVDLAILLSYSLCSSHTVTLCLGPGAMLLESNTTSATLQRKIKYKKPHFHRQWPPDSSPALGRITRDSAARPRYCRGRCRRP